MDQSSFQAQVARSNALLEEGHKLLSQLDADEKARQTRQESSRAQLQDCGLNYETLKPLEQPAAPMARMSAYPPHSYEVNKSQYQFRHYPQPLSYPSAVNADIQQYASTHHHGPPAAQFHGYGTPDFNGGQHDFQQQSRVLSSQPTLDAPILSNYPPRPTMMQTPHVTPFGIHPPSHPWLDAVPSHLPSQATEKQMVHERPEQFGISPNSITDQSSRPIPGPPKPSNVPFANMQGRKLSNARPVPKSQAILTKRTSSEQPLGPVVASENFKLPGWYGILSKKEKEAIAKKERNFNDLVGTFKQAKDHALRNGTDIDQLRMVIHQLEGKDVSREALIYSKLMEQQNLPAILGGQPANPLPFDIRADAKMLYTKWFRGDFSCDFERGIKTTRNAGRFSSSLDKSWGLRCSAAFFGEGDLVNGQWWPNRICALRDGAHGAIEAGISGHQGCASAVVIAHSHYDDIDHGDVIHYCGTEAKDSTKPTEDTTFLLNSCYEMKPVRVLRSSSLKSKFAPAKGYRYDGLYRVANYALIDRAKSHYRFHLARLPNQDPIRYEGVSARPNQFEMSFAQRKTGRDSTLG